MSKISRRDTLKYTLLAGISAGILPSCDPKSNTESSTHNHIHESRDGLFGLSEADKALLKQKFFTPEEKETVRVLANLIIPADDRSGNAEKAGVPAFIEFMMLDQPDLQTPMRGGLRWLDKTCLDQFEKSFVECTENQQKEILDQIAYPDIAKPEMSQGVAFFNMFRNFVATGFWTSKMGIEDLEYQGNKPNKWEGAPKAWLEKLGLSDEA